jgi:LruC domain-containing protein
MKKIVFLFALLTLVQSCINREKDLYDLDAKEAALKNANSFDFSTIQEVSLTIDYSRCNPVVPVFFSIYNENPLENDTLNESIVPIYEGYTNALGVFSETVLLPAYVGQLYVYTGNFFISEELMVAKVTNGKAYAMAAGEPAAARGTRAMRRAGAQTNSLETLYQLSYLVDWRTGDKTDTQVYKEWKTPLGTWDSESGRPNYLLSSSDPNYNQLIFSDEELKGVYQSITGALEDKKTCSATYRSSGDLTLTEDAEVAVTFLGSNTCWNSSIGYYYYMEGQEPQTTMDIDIIMLFPNAQDGKSKFVAKKGNNYYGNIALERGDVVKLMYYPHIANGDLSEATSVFPKGMKVGFILKSNAWGMQKPVGDKVYYNSYRGENNSSPIGRQYNSWASSTEGLSYCLKDAEQNAADPGAVSNDNPGGQCRTAKFAYENTSGKQYAIVTFEDACNDQDYDDIVFALKPVGVFKPLPSVEPRVTTTTGVYAFEDLWPSKGDYDLNDAVIDFKHNCELSVLQVGGDYMVTKETFSLTTYINYVTLQSGLALTLNTKKTPNSIVMKKIDKNGNVQTANFTKDGNVYLLTGNISGEVNTTYLLELNYNDGITVGNTASVQPFIYRNDTDNKRWEVHIPYEAPTSRMNYLYFGMYDDCSNPDAGLYYVRDSDYPFAFFLSGVTVANFTNTILLRENEQMPISDIYPQFLQWSISKGTQNKDWYKHPRNN